MTDESSDFAPPTAHPNTATCSRCADPLNEFSAALAVAENTPAGWRSSRIDLCSSCWQVVSDEIQMHLATSAG